MSDTDAMKDLLSKIDRRLDALDGRLDVMMRTRNKSMEWIATLSDHIASLDAFREEVRATFEPFVRKLDNLDDVMRILRHATSDVSRRIERIERDAGLRQVG